MTPRADAGFTLVELLVSFAVFSVVVTGFASFMLGSARLNKSCSRPP